MERSVLHGSVLKDVSGLRHSITLRATVGCIITSIQPDDRTKTGKNIRYPLFPKIVPLLNSIANVYAIGPLSK